jgi:hypothetical protein
MLVILVLILSRNTINKMDKRKIHSYKHTMRIKKKSLVRILKGKVHAIEGHESCITTARTRY